MWCCLCRTNLFCFLCIFFYFFFFKICQHLHSVSPRPKKSDVFYWASSFFHLFFHFLLSLVEVKCAPWFCKFYLLYSKENVKRGFGKKSRNTPQRTPKADLGQKRCKREKPVEQPPVRFHNDASLSCSKAAP